MKRIKIGVFGTGRGFDVAKNFMLLGCDIVALCDFHEQRRQKAAKQLGGSAAEYDDFDKFLEHDMDAVILANYCNEHAPYAIKCFERGVHVFSECISNGTMAEGVALARAYKNTKSIYFLAENYPQSVFCREMKRVCDGKTLGKVLFAEGEYNHPGDPNDITFKKDFAYFPEHWRHYLPRTYYITHSLGPVMHITGATPKKVTAFASFAPVEGDVPTASNVGDRAAIILTQNDDGSVFRVTGCANFGAHDNSYRICGTEGQVENLRGLGNKIMLRYNKWSKPEGANETTMYEPEWDDKDENLIKQSGHGGSDLITARMFLDCIRENRQPEHPFDLHSAINMSSVAILAHRSMLEGGMPYDIPDFTKEEDLARYENDTLTPFVKPDGSAPDIPCCSVPDFKPTQAQLEKFRTLVMDENNLSN